jgi:hypothetical protein
MGKVRCGRFSLCAYPILALQLALAVCLTVRASPFLGPDANVVLLTGLPGDLESESTYRDQLRAWLQVLEGVRPRQIIVLSDNPESIGLTGAATNISLIVFPSSRSNFLSAASLFGGGTNRLVVIAWGHGGKQGNTPVFHVRGPRIIPSDMSAFAEKIGPVDSQWLLCFRGSGFFASKLAGEHRQIISSESETIFNSDPIEMSLMLKITQENPTIPFESFTEDIGRATAQWYKEHNLARTEEPTLWLPKQKPKLLAAAFEERALTSVDSAIAKSSNKSTNEADGHVTDTQPNTQTSTANLPENWKELKRVDAQNYPDSDAVLLRRRITYTLAANPAVVAEHDDFVQILTAEGKRFGDFDISFSPPSEDINFSECEVLSPQGRLTRLNPESIREANDESLGDYNAGRRKFFSLPGIVPGAILHVRYRNEWKKFPLPHVSLEIPVSGELPAAQATLEIAIPKDEPFHFALENMSSVVAEQGSPINADPLIKQTDYGTTYTWRFTNLLAESREILAPPRRGISLLLSTFPDWSDFADWYARVSRLTGEVTPEIKARAAELTREAKNDREKILSVYNYVTGLRYVAVPLGVNSFRPHAAANVFKNQFGDCKDKANLFNTMLQSLGINAHLVLVPRFRQAYDALPGLAFNHAISRVTLPDETLWVDTTDDVCRFGMLPPGDSGRKVLVIAEQTNSLTQLPTPDANRHKLMVRGKIDCSHGAAELPASFEVMAFGYPDYELRESARDAKERAGSVAFLSARYRLSAGSFALEKQSATPIGALDKDFSWRAEGNCIGICSAISDNPKGSANQRAVRPPFWLPKEWELALNRRRSALFLNQGYPLTLEEQLEFVLPPKSRIVSLPAVATGAKGPLLWKLEWKAGDAKVIAALHAELSLGEVSATNTSALQEQLRALISAVNAGVTFETD